MTPLHVAVGPVGPRIPLPPSDRRSHMSVRGCVCGSSPVSLLRILYGAPAPAPGPRKPTGVLAAAPTAAFPLALARRSSRRRQGTWRATVAVAGRLLRLGIWGFTGGAPARLLATHSARQAPASVTTTTIRSKSTPGSTLGSVPVAGLQPRAAKRRS
jgi:hypothetical protein